MTPYQFRKLMGNGTPTPVVPSNNGVVGLNSAGSAFFDIGSVSVNLFNNVGRNSNGTGANALDSYWRISGLGPGQFIYFNLWLSQPGLPKHKIKTGTYHLYWTGDDLSVSISCNHWGGSLNRISAGHYTFTLNQFPATPTLAQFQITFTNPAGVASGTQMHMGIVHDDYFAYWLADHPDSAINPDYIAFAGQHLSTWRNMKADLIENNCITTDINAILTETHLFWGGDFVYNPGGPTDGQPYTTGLPYSIVAKICAKLNNPTIICCLPLGGSNAVWAAAAAQILSVPEFTGKIIPIPGNENWGGYKSPLGNATPGGNSAVAYLNNVYPGLWPGTTFVNWRAAESHACARAWRVFIDAGFPESRILLGLEQQFVVPSGGGIVLQDALNWVDTTNVMGKGNTTRFKDVLQVYLVAPYTTPAFNTTGDTIFNGRYCEVDWLNATDGYIDTLFDNDIFRAGNTVDGIVSVIKPLCPNAIFLCYEWGQQIIGSISGLAGQNFHCTTDVAARTIKSVPGEQPFNITKDGDGFFFYYNQDPTTGGPWSGYTNGQLLYTRRRLGNPEELYCYVNQTGPGSATFAYATDADAKAAAIALDRTANPGLPFWCANGTRINEGTVRLQTYMDGVPGREMYKRHFAATIGPNKMLATCQLSETGEYSDPNSFGIKMFGLLANLYADPTPRSIWHNNQVTYTP